MPYKRKIKYFMFVAALIAPPLRGFAETAEAPSQRVIYRSAGPDKAEGEPLFLSLSLSLSRFLLSPPPLTQFTPENEITGRKAIEEPLRVPLLLTLSPLSQLMVKTGGDNATAIEKPGSRSDDVTSREMLFGSTEPAKVKPAAEPIWKQLVTGWHGFSQLEIADTYSSPEHLSKAKLRTELSRTGKLNEHVKWKVSGRFDYDAAYDLSSFYPSAVRHDQRQQFFLRENYLDISAGNFDFRLGRQHVIWGEMVGLFFADVVSAKDLREFVLPSFDIIRIPQWAMRAEYSKNDLHAEVVWIPVPTFDEIGRPGADFYPGPLRGTANFLPEDRSGRNVANSNYGFRLSQLKNGWDLSAFYYHSIDASQTFYRVSEPGTPLVFQARHDPIDQFGGTLAKDFGSVVLKGELIYTDGRKFNVGRPTAENGLVRQNTLDYVLGLDFTLPAEARLNVQFFQRVFFAHDPGIVTDRLENGASILLAGKVWRKLEAQALLIHSLNRSDWMFRPRLTWDFRRNWRGAIGADVFGGPPTGLFGRFDQSDRVYTELRYSF